LAGLLGGEREMAERMALGFIPGAGWRASDIRSVAQAAEASGFEAIFATEVNNDVLATALLMGEATNVISVGTWVANIYLRHPYLCAKGVSGGVNPRINGASSSRDQHDTRPCYRQGRRHPPLVAQCA
jgi:hypothetical protein